MWKHFTFLQKPECCMCNKEMPGSPMTMTGLAWSQMTVMDLALTVEGEGVLFKMDTRRAVHHTP